jgi:hypothetical protein
MQENLDITQSDSSFEEASKKQIALELRYNDPKVITPLKADNIDLIKDFMTHYPHSALRNR